MALRLPDKGSSSQKLKPIDQSQCYLAPLLGRSAEPSATFKGNPLVANWLPNQDLARKWEEYVKTGEVTDRTPPPAPSSVIMAPNGDTGTLLTWSADADFESGIRCFIIMRDGTKLAQVPEKPFGQYGLPLFQSMTFHDTPRQPLPEMKYLDTSAKAGEKHVYTVVTINAVELSSEPSAPAVAK